MTFQGKIIFNLKWCINNLNVNSIQFPEWFSNFSAKNNTQQSNVRDGDVILLYPCWPKVVYKFQCLHDVDKVYIGKTRRHLATRVKEHGHSTSSSAIRDHLSSCPTCQSEYSSSSFRVIDTARNDFEVTIKEALHIKNSKPALNRQLFNSGSSFVLNIF